MNTKFLIKAILVIFVIVIIYIVSSNSIKEGYIISKGSQPILTPNWWNAFNWIKNNTPECSVIATYWDPGHFIRGIAERSPVFDGASQGATITQEIKSTNLTEDDIKRIAIVDNYDVDMDRDIGITKITTSRIEDIATVLFTDSENKAVNILSKYKKPNCTDGMYFLATSDLVGKSVWWTYFSTWKPDQNPHGQQYQYRFIGLSDIKQLQNNNAIAYVYGVDNQNSFILLQQNNNTTLVLRSGGQTLPVENLFYFDPGGRGVLKHDLNAPVKGMLWITGDMQLSIFIPEQIQNSLFTKMFFFNGAGLQKFEFIGDFGGEVKIFKVKL